MKAQRTIVQLALMNETGDSYYRMRWPAAQLAKFEPSWRIINLDASAKERFEWAERADLLVLYQSSDLELLPVLERRREQSRKTLAEYNDNFYAPQAWSPVVQEWSSPLVWQAYERIMSLADEVLVTGPGLEQLFAATVARKQIHILPNCFPFELEPFDSLYSSKEQELILAWGGSLGHMADLLSIAPLLREVLEETPHLRLHIMGNKAIPDLLRLPADRFQFTAWGAVQDYFRFLRNAHLGVIPLLDTEYNRCRSDIKAVELAALGVLPLVPDILPYQEFIQTNGIQPYRNFQELKERIAHYIMRPERIREEAERCYNYVQNTRLGSVDRRRLQLYSQSMSGKSDTSDWPVGAGYHEISGTPQDKSSLQEILAIADSFVKLRQFDDAARTLDRYAGNNPFVPEVALAQLKVARTRGDTTALSKLSDHMRRYPRDLRFQLLQAQWSTSADNLLSAWSSIVETLRPAPRAYQDFFRGQVLKLFLTLAQANAGLMLAPGESLLGIYPDAAELRFFLAQAYEQRGDFQLSLAHFNWLRDTKRLCDPNAAILQGIDRGYLEAWCDTLEARLRGH